MNTFERWWKAQERAGWNKECRLVKITKYSIVILTKPGARAVWKSITKFLDI